MIKTITLDCDDAIDYVRKNVKVYDTLELSYNRIFTSGEVIAMDTGKESGERACKVMIQLSSDMGTTVEVDLEKVKDDLVEVKHTSDDGEETTIISIESCDTKVLGS